MQRDNVCRLGGQHTDCLLPLVRFEVLKLEAVQAPDAVRRGAHDGNHRHTARWRVDRSHTWTSLVETATKTETHYSTFYD